MPDILTLFKIFTDFKQCFFVSIKEDNMNYVTLDDLDARNLALSDPKYFLEQYSYPLLIDEIQYAQDWDRWLKTIYDNQPDTRVEATGSASPALMK